MLAVAMSMPPAASSTAVVLPYRHTPVLVEEVLSFAPASTRIAVDCTVGAGGHAAALLERFPQAHLLGCDRDAAAIAAAQRSLAPYGERVTLEHIPFSEVAHHVLGGSVDFLLADLGVSSAQLEQGGRGFSFSEDGPLDMRMDAQGHGLTAAEVVNGATEQQLLALFRELGEERFAPRIARAIVGARPLHSTGELARVVAGAVPAKFHRRGYHPATQVFQALRIHVNDELGQLQALLRQAPHLLAPGGRMVVISFHSLEDRLVKEAFRRWEQPCECPPSLPRCVCGKVPLGRRLTRKPVQAGAAELARNPRARSAKLRAFGWGAAQP